MKKVFEKMGYVCHEPIHNTFVVVAEHEDMGVVESTCLAKLRGFKKHTGYFTGMRGDHLVRVYGTMDMALGACMIEATGSPKFLCWIHAEARKQGVLLNQYGMFDIATRDRILRTYTEQAVFDYLEIAFIGAEQRWIGRFK
jgi:DNA polymerase/3'-5' exonuclease PolX